MALGRRIDRYVQRHPHYRWLLDYPGNLRSGLASAQSRTA